MYLYMESLKYMTYSDKKTVETVKYKVGVCDCGGTLKIENDLTVIEVSCLSCSFRSNSITRTEIKKKIELKKQERKLDRIDAFLIIKDYSKLYK